jgi:hypothetical protein
MRPGTVYTLGASRFLYAAQDLKQFVGDGCFIKIMTPWRIQQ